MAYRVAAAPTISRHAMPIEKLGPNLVGDLIKSRAVLRTFSQSKDLAINRHGKRPVIFDPNVK